MVSNENKLAALRQEFVRLSLLLTSELSGDQRMSILLEKVKIANRMREIWNENAPYKPEISMASSHNKDFVDKMRQKGLIFRHVGE